MTALQSRLGVPQFSETAGFGEGGKLPFAKNGALQKLLALRLHGWRADQFPGSCYADPIGLRSRQHAIEFFGRGLQHSLLNQSLIDGHRIRIVRERQRL
jgi:hypothetical protein